MIVFYLKDSKVCGKDIHRQAALQDVVVRNGDGVKGGHDFFSVLLPFPF